MRTSAGSTWGTPSITESEKPLRIAIVSDWYLPRQGGIELYLSELAARLNRAGHDVEVLTPVPGPAEVNGVRVHRLCDPDRPDGGYRFPPPLHSANGRDFLYLLDLLLAPHRPNAVQRLRARLSEGAYDVAHVHLGNTPFTYLATRACIELGHPTVATFHSVLARAERPIAALAGRLARTRNWAGRVHLTAVSGRAARDRAVMLGAAPFHLLPNGLDTQFWDELGRGRVGSRAEGRRQTIELVSAMRLHPRKRPDVLIDAVAALTQNGSPVRLRIAGDGPLRGPLQRRIDGLGLAGRVELCGQLGRDGLAQLLREADLFLMPSLHESFGIAMLEARISGVPVLAMRRSGASDFLKSGEDSLLVDSDREFLEALQRFVADPALRSRLDPGCAVPLTGYSWDDVVANCTGAYAAAIAMRGPGQPIARSTRE
jgi:glycosyltransferase involved in cell wall biosynthesis